MVSHLRHRLLAVDLPGRGRHPGDLAAMSSRIWADSVIADMDAAGIERAAAVGHSLGGLTLTTLALHYPDRLSRLAFVACPCPEEGGCFGEACAPESWEGMQAAWRAGLRSTPLQPRESQIARFGNDMDAATQDRMCAETGSESLGVFMEPLSLAGLRRGIPALYIKLLQDCAAHPWVQDNAIAAIRPDAVRTLDCGHMAMYSRPRELAQILNEWADCSGKDILEKT